MKVPDEVMDLDELEAAEYTEGQTFTKYDGEPPPKDTKLSMKVEKIWWTYTQNDDPMLKVILIADGNVGEEEQYEGCDIWDNITLNPKGKFRWKPFIDALGIKLADIKNKMVLDENDDPKMGAPVLKIGNWVPNTDAAYLTVITGREKFNGEWQTRAAEYLEYEDPEDEEEEPEEEPEPTPAPVARAGSRRANRTAPVEPDPEPEEEEDEEDPDEEDEEEDDPEDELEDEEEEEEPTPAPTRRRRTAAAAPTPEPAKPAAPARRPARTARTATPPPAAAKPARGRRPAASKPDAETPF